jgi:cytoskeletal protein CcmA (bactofilin family)
MQAGVIAGRVSARTRSALVIDEQASVNQSVDIDHLTSKEATALIVAGELVIEALDNNRE